MFIVPSPSTINVALESPKPSLKHSTNDWLFSDATLLIVRLAGFANVVVSGDVTWGNKAATPLLAAEIALPPGTLKSIAQNTPPLSGKLLLQVNVILPPSGTTYPPGAGSASADRVTIYTEKTDCQSHNVYRMCRPQSNMTHLASVQTCTSCYTK